MCDEPTTPKWPLYPLFEWIEKYLAEAPIQLGLDEQLALQNWGKGSWKDPSTQAYPDSEEVKEDPTSPTSPHGYQIGDRVGFNWNDGTPVKPRWNEYPGNIRGWTNDGSVYDIDSPDFASDGRGREARVPHHQITGKIL